MQLEQGLYRRFITSQGQGVRVGSGVFKAPAPASLSQFFVQCCVK